MTELILPEKAANWHRLKSLVLDSVSSPITKRVYNLALNEFIEWFGKEPRPGFTKATVSAWRVALEARGLGPVSLNVRIVAARKLAVDAAENWARLFDSVLCFCYRSRLQPHVGRVVGAAALQRNDVIDDVTGTRA